MALVEFFAETAGAGEVRNARLKCAPRVSIPPDFQPRGSALKHAITLFKRIDDGRHIVLRSVAYLKIRCNGQSKGRPKPANPGDPPARR